MASNLDEGALSIAPGGSSDVEEGNDFPKELDVEGEGHLNSQERSDSIPGDSDDSDYEDDRENRFLGPSSTWHKYTADERGLAAALTQQRAGDLSVHLYNAHSYKALLRDSERAAAAKPWQSKSTWLGRDENGKLPWLPPSRWAAWPLRADDVPRKEEGHGQDLSAAYDEETIRKSKPWRPSQDLEDELQGLMLRNAKDRFRRRNWVEGQDRTPRPEQRREDSAAKAESGTDGEEKPNGLSATVYQRPDFLADDDEAHEILKPTLRHMLTKLDDLLTGLHKSRAGMRRPRSTKSRAPSQPSAFRSRSGSQAKPARSRSRRRKSESSNDSVNDSPLSDDDVQRQSEDNDAFPEPQTTKRKRISGPSNHHLGQRDWSDVLGMAAMTGWDPAVIDRAAKRCASLFGETMFFRAMPETAADNLQDEVFQYRPDMISLTDSDGEDGEGVVRQEEPQYFCPYETCARHHGAYILRWRWRQHLQREHKMSKAEVANVEQQFLASMEAEVAPDIDLTNEDESPGDEVVGVDELEDDSDTGVAVVSATSMLGAVHRDGFMLPITGQLSRGKALKPTRRRRRTVGEAAESPPKRQRLEESGNEIEAEESDAEF